MSVWIDFTAYAALTAVLWFAMPRANRRFATPLLADRNPDWVAAHPDAALSLTGGRWYGWSCHGWGIVSLLALLAFQLGYWPDALSPAALDTERWEVLAGLNALLLAIGVVWVLGCHAVLIRRVRSDVPLTARRHATLERRSLSDLVPRWVRLLTYTILASHWTAWVAVGVAGSSIRPGHWARGMAPVAFAAIGFLFVRHFIHRRPHALDRVFGPAHRCGEVRTAFVFIVFTQVTGALQLYQDVGGPIADVDRLMRLLLVIVVTAGLLKVIHSSGNVNPPDRVRNEPGTETPLVTRGVPGGGQSARKAMSGSIRLARRAGT